MAEQRLPKTAAAGSRARPGYPGWGRDLLPEERIDEIVEYRAEQGRRCGLSGGRHSPC
jgi:hypothetical protein